MKERANLRSWLADSTAQAELDGELRELVDRLGLWVQRRAEADAAPPDSPPAALVRVAVAAALRDAASDLLTLEAARARRDWPLTAIAEASGMEPTSSPARNFRGFADLIAADAWALLHPGEDPEPVRGRRIDLTLGPRA